MDKGRSGVVAARKHWIFDSMAKETAARFWNLAAEKSKFSVIQQNRLPAKSFAFRYLISHCGWQS
jgi:hypothetical protein